MCSTRKTNTIKKKKNFSSHWFSSLIFNFSLFFFWLFWLATFSYDTHLIATFCIKFQSHHMVEQAMISDVNHLVLTVRWFFSFSLLSHILTKAEHFLFGYNKWFAVYRVVRVVMSVCTNQIFFYFNLHNFLVL